MILGVVPFGLTCGIMGLTVGLTAFETILMSGLVFAGAAQFTAMLLLGSGAVGFGVVVLTTVVVNLRHILMSASLASVIKKLSLPLKSILIFSLTDEAFAITTARMEKSTYSGLYQAVVSLLLYITWILTTAIGVLFTSYIADPLAWGLDFAMPASFIVFLIHRLKNATSAVVALVAGVSSVAGALLLPGKWYIIIACVLACTVGFVIERRG
ncbi:MAG: AzlC family ABC transporter permease [Firmicutes bacterium]|nr:AzlC family ABC transporter permease [Bacillota bacterium]